MNEITEKNLTKVLALSKPLTTSDQGDSLLGLYNQTFTLPASPSEGDFYYIKNFDGADATCTINGNGGKTIDGQSSITLDVPNASVKLVFDADVGVSGGWFIF